MSLPVPQQVPLIKTRIARMEQALKGKRSLLILTHDNPDPDALGAAMGLAKLVEKLTGVKAVIAYGGIIGRAENKAFVKVLRIPVIHLNQLRLTDFEAVALVDTQPGAGNNSFPSDITPTMVFDHHPPRGTFEGIPVVDIQVEFGSTTALVFQYLLGAEIPLTPILATAAYYAIKSDTRDLALATSAHDRELYLQVAPLVNRDWLAEIENPPISLPYYQYLIRAMSKARVAGPLVVVHLGEVALPDVVAQVADFLMPLKSTQWTLITGIYQGNLYLSFRTRDLNGDAGDVANGTVDGLGKAGGHEARAGGKIPLQGIDVAGITAMYKTIEERLCLKLFDMIPPFEPLSMEEFVK